MFGPGLAEAQTAASERTVLSPNRWPNPWLTPATLALAGVTVLGIALRAVVARQSLFGDELSTYWISATHGLRTVVSLLYGTASIHHAEITPPLYFVAAWLTTQLGHTPELLRAPSLIAGSLTIPAVYLVGQRTVGRRAALCAAALTALSPFMIYYSTEARAYAVMMLLVVLSTLTMLLAAETRRARWWVMYAVCSCLAVYTHLTSVFALGVQLLWLLWAHPEARRAAIAANLGVLAGLLPWTVGFVNDLASPTVKILSALSPFSAHQIPIILGHWAVGYPYATSVTVTQLPGTFALVLLAAATIVAITAAVRRAARDRRRGLPPELHQRVLLIGALALATPVGEAVVSAFSTHIFGVRNLAASWPALGLLFAALLTSAGSRWRFAAVGLALASFAIGADRMLVEPYERPDYQAAADYLARHAGPEAVVIDETGELSPGPLTPLDIVLREPLRVFRAGSPAERDHPFGFTDPVVPLAGAIRGAVAASHGASVFVVSTISAPSDIVQLNQRTRPQTPRFPAPYRLVAAHVYPGIARVEVSVYSERPSRS